MNAKHVVVGGGAASLVAGVVAVLTKGHVHLTTYEAVTVGSAALAVGSSLAARLDRVGVKGLFKGLWSGNAPAA